MESYNLWSFVLAPSLKIMFSRFIQVVACIRRHSSLWPNSIPLHNYITFCLCITQLMDIWVVSICLLWIMLLSSCIYNFTCGCKFSFLYIYICGIAIVRVMVYFIRFDNLVYFSLFLFFFDFFPSSLIQLFWFPKFTYIPH